MKPNLNVNLMQDVPFFNCRKIKIELKTKNPKSYCLEFIKYQTPNIKFNLKSSKSNKIAALKFRINSKECKKSIEGQKDV